jgi:GT2 family glycosyltransferase
MSTDQQVSVVVTSHNSGEALVATLRALEGSSLIAAIHLVDSGSEDGMPDRVAELFKNVMVTKLGSNRGPCATRNRGLELCTTPWVLLLDDDTVITEEGLKLLLQAAAADERLAMVGPRITFEGDAERVQYEGGLWHFTGLPHMLNLERVVPPGNNRFVDVLTSGCVLVRREHILAAGGFDENLFFLMEDVELSVRLKLLGLRLMVVPSARAVNQGNSEGLSLKTDLPYPKRRVFLHSRNRCLLLISCYRPFTLFLLSPALAVMEAAWFLFALREGAISSYLLGKLDVLKRLRKARARRSSLLPLRVLEDNALLTAPSLTLTESALRKPLARPMLKVLNASLSFYCGAVSGVVR